MTNQLKNLYLYHILKSGSIKIDENYSFLHASIIHLVNEIDVGAKSAESFAMDLLETINNSNTFLKVDRVCLSLIQPKSYTLKIFSSANTSRLKDNIMPTAYSCLVRGNSSLMVTKRSDMRIYSNIADIVKTYDDKPIQRSLKFLQTMGVKSGIAIPLTEFGLQSGILFLNSADIGGFNNLNSQDYATLCLIKIAVNNVLYKYVYHHSAQDQRLINIMQNITVNNVFDIEDFKSVLKKIATERFGDDFKLTFNNNSIIDHRILFNFLPLVYLIMRSLEVAQTRSVVVETNLVTEAGQPNLVINLRGCKLDFNTLAYLETLGFLPNQNIRLLGDQLSFINSVEIVPDGVDYST
jgi:hypothetical protein